MRHGCRQPGIRHIVAAQLFVEAELPQFDHSGPKGASCTPGDANSASTNATASSIGVGCWKIFGLVTSRRKLASTIGISVKAAPAPDAVTASSSQSRATA